MNLSYRILDCNIFESYMALEGWDSFPLLNAYTTNGEFSFLLKDCNYMIFDYMPSDGLLKAVCIYRMLDECLSIELFEVNKDYRGLGIGTYAMERLMIETGAKTVYLDAKNSNAEVFWKSIGLKKIDNQTFCLDTDVQQEND